MAVPNGEKNGNLFPRFVVRIAEMLIGPAIVGLIFLWGSHSILGVKVEALTQTISSMQSKLDKVCDWAIGHQSADSARQDLLKDIRDDQIRRQKKER